MTRIGFVLVVLVCLFAWFVRPATSDAQVALDEIEFIRGDVNGDGSLKLDDAIMMIDFLFQSGPALPCLSAADTDGNNAFDGLLDVVFLLDAIFLESTPPPAPYPDCGLEPDTTPVLGCNEPSCP